MKKYIILIAFVLCGASATAQNRINLDSSETVRWQTLPDSELDATPEIVSSGLYVPKKEWLPAIVPGTVLNTDVANNLVPEPYYGLNNKLEKELIPDLAKIGRQYYTRWLRTEFEVPETYNGQQVWLQFDGINYHAEIWVNGRLLSTSKGMFLQNFVNVTEFVKPGAKNVLAVKVSPVDMPGTMMPKKWGAKGEWHNGGDGRIGLNTTMLMTVGWDFTFIDGIRDRNTGIWRSVWMYATPDLDLRHAFVKSGLDGPKSRETVSVEVVNPTHKALKCKVRGSIEGICFEKEVEVLRGCTAEVVFTPEEFPQLVFDNPRLWWPVNKGPQNLYELKLTLECDGHVSDSLCANFGIREIASDQNTPDGSRQFYVNGHPLFVRGDNWIPEAMQRTDDARTEAELRYTAQSGINLLRLWGGGIAESDRFYELCDKYGILVWQEFWMTGDTEHPQDAGTYYANVTSTVKRIRNHPSLAYYVCSNESTEMPGMRELLQSLDGTRGYQMQSECDGVHDGSPYKQVNPMRHYENTASDRGSRVDGFNPEYGAPMMPLASSLRRMMPEADLWPINREVWDYHDGGGFSQVSTLYRQMTDEYGESSSLEEFCKKAQLVAAVNSKAIWEVWNYNKLEHGDRYCSGLLFWFHNSANPSVCGHIYDYYLEPTAALYHTASALEPLHVQYDYLKRTVSAVNDYLVPFEGGSVDARVYSLDSKVVWTSSVPVSIAADGVACDVLTVGVKPAPGTVQFLSLVMRDSAGAVVSENFYWISGDAYEGKKTLTGPCTSGFQPLQDMPSAKLSYKSSVRGRFVDVLVRNRSSRIAFFNQLHVVGADGAPVLPCYCSDNFFTLLPWASKTVTIELPDALDCTIECSGWNVADKSLIIK